MAYRYITRRGETSYAFARELRPLEAVAAVPPGYSVYESPYSGRPYLRKVVPQRDA